MMAVDANERAWGMLRRMIKRFYACCESALAEPGFTSRLGQQRRVCTKMKYMDGSSHTKVILEHSLAEIFLWWYYLSALPNGYIHDSETSTDDVSEPSERSLVLYLVG
jgi:hypothetical protein